MNQEIEKQLRMTYYEQTQYLQRKYGLLPHDYFYTKECKSIDRRNSRTSEGLVIHHIAEFEDDGGNLGNVNVAYQYPYEYQKRENLTYCNLLEHLLLHLKINTKNVKNFQWPYELQYFFRSQGFLLIVGEINFLYYRTNDVRQEWRMNCYHAIKDFKNDYIHIIRGLLYYVISSYTGDKDISVKEGVKIALDIEWRQKIISECCFIIEKIVDEKGLIVLHMTDDRIPSFPSVDTMASETIREYIELFHKMLIQLWGRASISPDDEEYIPLMMRFAYPEEKIDVSRFRRWYIDQQLVWSLKDIRERFNYKLQVNAFLNRIFSLSDSYEWTGSIAKPIDIEDKAIAKIIKENLL